MSLEGETERPNRIPGAFCPGLTSSPGPLSYWNGDPRPNITKGPGNEVAKGPGNEAS